ncbi:30S ribosomal protein S19e [Sulfolobus sp. A20]|uniref:30S ribosomal protein S19e n=1 Tax=Sulfolobaceae TaxID=118883 RepID=UPI0008460733|nr:MULTISPECIES: 30S ribosomal protein S19e [unclassified Sulfolobus]TRM74617.1 30S ribosomal protein S19e [Sulfolobus sp. E5]TRM81215.1 30S ribosomal protein S19e [Sulfolobus sp. D5]TRM87557.1 30S ribosomal protein S19e [Sulfolobus sp. E3]TRM93343.1 30S ribosomal protein S19e [Sulfolobus sp. A20-N-G8]TRM98392.1 30S ribosomal protein S19e [Sulfolobus sp. F1]TRN00522.1 30S ribosomal protein S19e [Sulfolobus sp. E1]
MITAEMVPYDILIKRLASYIKENVKTVSPPEWAIFAKTASFKERVPDNPEEWWYVRAASLLRKVYVNGSVGIEKSKIIYGGSKRRGTKPERSVRAPGHANRLILQQLEKAGLVQKVKNKGRVLTPRGRALLDKIAYEIFKELADNNPSLKVYLE